MMPGEAKAGFTNRSLRGFSRVSRAFEARAAAGGRAWSDPLGFSARFAAIRSGGIWL